MKNMIRFASFYANLRNGQMVSGIRRKTLIRSGTNNVSFEGKWRDVMWLVLFVAKKPQNLPLQFVEVIYNLSHADH